MNTIEKLDKLECCGCSSCVQKCPQNAIEMKANEESSETGSYHFSDEYLY